MAADLVDRPWSRGLLSADGCCRACDVIVMAIRALVGVESVADRLLAAAAAEICPRSELSLSSFTSRVGHQHCQKVPDCAASPNLNSRALCPPGHINHVHAVCHQPSVGSNWADYHTVMPDAPSYSGLLRIFSPLSSSAIAKRSAILLLISLSNHVPASPHRHRRLQRHPRQFSRPRLRRRPQLASPWSHTQPPITLRPTSKIRTAHLHPMGPSRRQ